MKNRIAQFQRVLGAFLAAPNGFMALADLKSIEDIVPSRLSVYLWECKLKGGAVIIRNKAAAGYNMTNVAEYPSGDNIALITEEAKVAEVIQSSPMIAVVEALAGDPEVLEVLNELPVLTPEEPVAEVISEPVPEVVEQGEQIPEAILVAQEQTKDDMPAFLQRPLRDGKGHFVKKSAA